MSAHSLFSTQPPRGILYVSHLPRGSAQHQVMVPPLTVSSSHYGNDLAPATHLTWFRLQWLCCSSHRPGTQLFHLWFSLPGKLLSQLPTWLSLISFMSYSNTIRVAILTVLNWASSIHSGLHHSSAVAGGGVYPVQRGTLSSIPGVYLLDAHSIPLFSYGQQLSLGGAKLGTLGKIKRPITNLLLPIYLFKM